MGVATATAIVCAAIGLYIGLYLANVPGSAAAVTSSQGTSLYLATVPAAALSDPHNTWVSYYAVNSSGGDWRHDTTYVLPAHTLVHVTIFQYDSPSGIRNQFLSQAQGTTGGTFQVNGAAPEQAIASANTSHIFAVPQLGLSVPLQGVSGTAKNACANAPCSPTANAVEKVTFTFRTPGKGLYRWQCFVPCAAGYIDGFGGPMQTVGYMDGFLKVV